MIINIGGTSGSGKSTIVRALIDDAPGSKGEICEVGGKLIGHRINGYGDKTLHIVGPYNKPTGGCDNISPLYNVFDIVKHEYGNSGNKHNVLFEGLLVSRSKGRLVDLWDHINRKDFYVYKLNTSLEDCIKSIEMRRMAKGNKKPVNSQRTEETFHRVNKIYADLKALGIPVEEGTRAEIYVRILKRLRGE